MFNTLFSRTFTIVAAMLLITSVAAQKNKTYETKTEMWGTIIGIFAFLFAIMFFADWYPVNLALVGIFSGLVGWSMGPTIESLGQRYTQKNAHKSTVSTPWNQIVSQAVLSTAVATAATAAIVAFSPIDFSFLGGFLLIALLILIVMGLANAFFFKSKLFALVRAYVGVVLFTLYLLYDFNRLEKLAGDESWGTAINIAVSIYLDIINLFLSILEILASSD